MQALVKAMRGERYARLMERRGETSPLLPPPSPNRREYPFVASMVYQGIPLDIEQRKGDVREGVDRDGTPWKVTMQAHYGEVRSHVRGAAGVMGARGMDGDRLDVYIGDDPDSDVVVVVDQRVPETGEHDEQKVMLGFSSVAEALGCYRAQYTKPGFYGGHSTMTVDQLRRWISQSRNAGQRIDLQKALETLPPGALVLPDAYGRQAFLAQLFKGAGHKYVKRVPTGKFTKTGKPKYRYFYNAAAGKGGVHALEHFVVGAGFKADGGHWHITGVDDDRLTIEHDESKATRTITKHELSGMLYAEHKAGIDQHQAERAKRLEAERAEATAHGTVRHRVALGLYGFLVHIPRDTDTRGWTDVDARDHAVLDALSQATSLAEVEDALRGVKHREFVAMLDDKGQVLSVAASVLIPEMPDHTVTAANVSIEFPANARTAVVTHNHAAETPLSAADIVTAVRHGLSEIRAVNSHATWSATFERPRMLPDANLIELRRTLDQLIAHVEGIVIRNFKDHDPQSVRSLTRTDGALIEVVDERFAPEWHRQISAILPETLEAGLRILGGRVRVEPHGASQPLGADGHGSRGVPSAAQRSRGERSGVDGPEASAPVGPGQPEHGVLRVAEGKRGDLQAVGDHIWGSRKDLASLGRIESSKQLEGMSYADAAAIVTKAKLVTPLDLEDARALGMQPAVAHLFMHMLSTVRAKPDDSALSRAAFVDEVREIQGAMRRVKTVEDFKALRSEMISKWRSAPEWVRSPHVAIIEYPMFSDEARAEARRLTKETGIEHRVVGSYSSYRSHLVMAQQRPYESLGTRFVNTLTESTPGARKDFREAANRALELARMSDENAWEALKTGPVSGQPKTSTGSKPKPNTERGHSAAKSESAEVVRVGGRPVVDANPTRVRDTFNLREVDFGQGSYMTQADREHHVKQLEGALHDLVDVLGLPPEQVSFHGRLGVALGARGRGKAAAHYEPGRAAINITKFAGGGALAHEWGHALDNIIAGHYIKSAVGSSKGDAFLTKLPEHSALPAGLQSAVKAVHDAIHLAANGAEAAAGRRAQIEELTADRKRWGEAYAKAEDSTERERFRHEHNRATKRLNQFLRMPQDRSSFFREAFAKDNPEGKPYWSTPVELFARAFESYIHDKLAENGRKNTYLTDQRGAGEPGWYPQGEERQRINQSMDGLVAFLRSSGDLAKALRTLVPPRRKTMSTTALLKSLGMAVRASHEPALMARIQSRRTELAEHRPGGGLLALLKAKYKRKVPTGRTTKTGRIIYRYIYDDEGAVRGAAKGEHINLQHEGIHEVAEVDHEGVTLKHSKSGEVRRLTHAELHERLASAYHTAFDRAAERMIRRYVEAAADLDVNPSDAAAVEAALAERFKAAKVDAEQARRLVAFVAERPGWHTDAKKALLVMASDPVSGQHVAPRARQIGRAAENLSRAEGADQVEARHVGQAVALRLPKGGFDERFAEVRHQVAVELARSEALLGAIEAAGENAAARKAMVDFAQTHLTAEAGHDLERLVEAFPGLRDTPEIRRLQSTRARWQSILAERDQRKPGKQGLVGVETTVYIADADGNPTPQQARYRLVEAGDARASHDPLAGFKQRSDYPGGVQERAYHRDKAEQEKVRRNAQRLQPAYVINTNPDAVNGPPVMTADGLVLGGNSRTMSLQLAYADHPDAAKAYRRHLKEQAHAFGFSHADVDAMESPILVREVDVEDQGKENLGVLVRRYNESFTQGMDPRVDQVARGRMVTSGMLDSIASGMGRTNDAGEPQFATLKEFLSSSEGIRFVAELSSSREGKGIIDRRNRSQYVGKDGRLNEDGKTFVERVLVGHVLPDPDLLSEMLPKHVSSIAASVPHVVAAAGKGHDIKGALRTALEAHAYMRRKKLVDVDEYDRDSGGFASLGVEGFEQKPKLDGVSKTLLGVLVERLDKPVQLAGFFRSFAKQAAANPAGQSSLLGDSMDTSSILNAAAERQRPGPRDLFRAVMSPANASTWVALDEGFAEALWSSVIAKGGSSRSTPDGQEVLALPWWVAYKLDPAGLFKHRGAIKYVKRVPTGRFRKTKSGAPGAPIYRYYYKVEHGGGVANAADMVEGASFRHGAGELTIHGVKDGKLVTSHSGSPGKLEHLTHAELASRLGDHHGGAMALHREKLLAELKEARQYGSKKHVDRLLEEMKRKGIKPDPENWEEFKPRPKGVPVDFTGHPLAGELAKVPADHFVAYTVKKVGKEVGKKGEKRRVGNAKVLTHLVTGFDYDQLMADSQTALDKLTVDAMFEKAKGRKGWGGKDAGWIPVTREHVEEAFEKVREFVAKSLAKEHDKESGRRPLMVNGERVPGVSVYRGDETAYTGSENTVPTPASIYVAGIKVHSVELEPADNPDTETQSNPVTVARKLIESFLPVSHYRTYRLDPDEDWSIRVGPNHVITRENIQELFKAAFMRRKPAVESDFATFAEEGWNPEDPASYAGFISGAIDMSYLGIGGDERSEGDEGIEKSAPTHTWVPLEPAFGEVLWRSAGLSKATGNDDVRALPWWVSMRLDPHGLFKAGGKYIKRVPTGKTTKTGKPVYRYFYKVQHGGGVHNAEHFAEGASFKHGDGHYTIQGAKDGKLEVHHSKTGETHHLTHDELASKLKAYHAPAMDAHRQKLEREHAEALQAGNHKGAAKIRSEAARLGGRPIKEPGKIYESHTADYTSRVHHTMREDGQWHSRIQGRDASAGGAYRWGAWRPSGPPPEHAAETGKASRLPSAPSAETKQKSEREKLRREVMGAREIGRRIVDEEMRHHAPGSKEHEGLKDARDHMDRFDVDSDLSDSSQDEMEAPAHAALLAAQDARKRQPATGAASQSASASSPPAAKAASTDDHISSAKVIYGLSDKEAAQVGSHAYVKEAHRHAEAGDHDKAKSYVRLAVKDQLSRDSVRNLSPSTAERYMRKREQAQKLAKAIGQFLRAQGKIAA
jgi:hypothetical protein